MRRLTVGHRGTPLEVFGLERARRPAILAAAVFWRGGPSPETGVVNSLGGHGPGRQCSSVRARFLFCDGDGSRARVFTQRHLDRPSSLEVAMTGRSAYGPDGVLVARCECSELWSGDKVYSPGLHKENMSATPGVHRLGQLVVIGEDRSPELESSLQDYARWMSGCSIWKMIGPW